MDARSGNRTPPRTLVPSPEKRPWRPLAYVLFRGNVEVPGIPMRVNRLIAGEPVYMVEPSMLAPQPYYDADARMVVVKDRYYPIEHIESFSFARAAKADTNS